MQLDLSPMLEYWLTWGLCSPEDGLSWTLMHGTTSYDLRPQDTLEAPPSINLAHQLAQIDASSKHPSTGRSKEAAQDSFITQPKEGIGNAMAVADKAMPLSRPLT